MFKSAEEKTALVEFRALLGSNLIENAEDHYLLRWLRARDLNVDKAKEMLVRNLEWRKNNPQLKNLSTWMPLKEVAEDLTYKFTGFDFEGHPVLFMPIGAWNVRKLLETHDKNEIFQYFYKIMEEILIQIENVKISTGITDIVAIYDVAGLTFWKIASNEVLQVAKQFFREFESYYPEILYKVYVVNAHWAFSYAFKMIKHIMSANTIAKIEIMTTQADWVSKLRSRMLSECIPIECHRQEQPIKKLTKHMSCPP